MAFAMVTVSALTLPPNAVANVMKRSVIIILIIIINNINNIALFILAELRPSGLLFQLTSKPLKYYSKLYHTLNERKSISKIKYIQ